MHSLKLENNWDNLSTYIDESKIDNTTGIIGRWKELSDNSSYLVFSENEYYFYSDINNMEENYSTGKYSLINGNEKISGFNIHNRIINRIFNKIKEKLKEVNFSILELEPSKIVKNGKESNAEIEEESLIKIIVESSHENVIGLSLINLDEENIKYYYKVIE